MSTTPCPTPTRCRVAAHEAGSAAGMACAAAQKTAVTSQLHLRAAPPSAAVPTEGRLVRVRRGDDRGVVARVVREHPTNPTISFVTSNRLFRGSVTREIESHALEPFEEAELPEPVEEGSWVTFTLPAGVEATGLVTDGEPDGKGLVAVEYSVQGHQFEAFVHTSQLSVVTP